MLIYCNGDSFAAGHGLGDYLIPGFPGYWNFKDYTKSPSDDWVYGLGKGTRTDTLHKTPGLISQVLGQEKIEAWPNRLNQLLTECDLVINSAKQGSSHESILTRTTLDLIKLKQSDVTVDHVIIQLTSFARMSYPSIDNDGRYEDQDLILSMSWPGIPGHIRTISEWYVRHCPNPALIIRTLRNIAVMRATVQSLTGKEPIFVDSSMFLNQFTMSIMSDPLIQQYIDKFDLRDILFNTKMLRMEDIATPETLRCPCGHYGNELHKEFAQLIYDSHFSANK
jgi:hypothetical protein